MQARVVHTAVGMQNDAAPRLLNMTPAHAHFAAPTNKRLQARMRRPFRFSADDSPDIVVKLDNFLRLCRGLREGRVASCEGLDNIDGNNERSFKEHFGLDEMEAAEECKE